MGGVFINEFKILRSLEGNAGTEDRMAGIAGGWWFAV